VGCVEGQTALVVLVDKPDQQPVIIKSLPVKGSLYQYTGQQISQADQITTVDTTVTDKNAQIIYRAYITFEGDHSDTFTFNYNSNLGTITVQVRGIPPSSPTTPTESTESYRLVIALGIALSIMIIMSVLLAAFAIFFWKKKKARKEMITLFLGEDALEGRAEQTYFPDEVDLDDDSTL